MEFLLEYGLFLAKAVTFLIVLAVSVAIIAGAAMRNSKTDKNEIEIVKVNDDYDELEEDLQRVLLTEEEVKQSKKDKKKQAKLDKKVQKKQKSSKSDADKEEATKKKRIFVTEFDGDIKASDAEPLRQVINAILTVAKDEDEVVLKLESQGGMVHSYGYASSQLTRLRERGLELTVCVDKVAASGGYMMACVANKILAAPFAIIGSIGVVAQLPNFHRLLDKNNIDYEMYTAGEHKRTLTMFGENTDAGRKKFVEDLEDTHELFKQFISEYRPQVAVGEVATGEIWFGTRSLDNKLIDKIQTSDDYLFKARKDADIYHVFISEKKTLMEKLGINVEATAEGIFNRIFKTISNRYFV